MNKSEKIICLVLGAFLAWYIFVEMPKKAAPADRSKVVETAAERSLAAEGERQDKARRGEAGAERSLAAEGERQDKARWGEAAAGAGLGEAGAGQGEAAGGAKDKGARAETAAAERPTEPEKIVTLENDDVKLELSSWGAVVKKVTLKKYAKNRGEISEENPAVVMDFAGSPLGEGDGVGAFEVEADGTSARFTSGAKSRTVTLGENYTILFEDSGIGGPVSIGEMRMGDSKNDLLSVDSWARDRGKGKPGVVHHGDNDSPLKPYLVGGAVGGCSGSSSAAGMPAVTTVDYPGAQTWIAVKNRFFVTALVGCEGQDAAGFKATVRRDTKSANYRPESVAIKANFGEAASRKLTFFVGPKKQAFLWDLGMKDVMEFGMWRWLCYPLVWVMNLFNSMIPNYGIAIILLTILVRILFWPLTHKSTVGMKKMQEIQPLMKEIQAKFKDNPQRLQQETFALYREHKVNPMSSCLPMLIQIPIFIALFNVLRSAVELRYAPFLWIGDLSEPEALFASWFPFGGLNVLPILMAVSTALQSAFTPSAGDKKQQQMMMVMMPLMMLFMFYSFPSALSLYWFLSNLFSIVQMWLIRRQTQAAKQGEVITPEVIDPPQTRQMRRHS